MRPNADNQKFYAQGYRAYTDGKSMEDNPYLTHSQVSKSSWWQSGFIRASEHAMQIRVEEQTVEEWLEDYDG